MGGVVRVERGQTMWNRFERSSRGRTIMHSFVVGLAGLWAATVAIEGASGPMRVSENGRYFVDQQGKPFYFLADTQWELFRRYSLDEAKLILENRKAKGLDRKSV